METTANALHRIARMRRQLRIEAATAIPVTLALFAAAPVVGEAHPDAHFLFLIALFAFGFVLVRLVARAMAVFEHPCPNCREPFHGGLQRAIWLFPLLPRTCHHCGIDLVHARVGPLRTS